MSAPRPSALPNDEDDNVEAGNAEQVPLLKPSQADTERDVSKCRGILNVFLLGSFMILCSAAVINYNKFLISGRFPFPTHLVLCHMASGSIFSGLTLLMAPSLFPSFQDPARRAEINGKFLFSRVMPIALLFAASLVLSNVAYLYASVSFLQMMKQSNVVIVYVLSFFCGLEVLRARNLLILLFILTCTTMTITGEMNFSLKGTLIQGSCQVFESIRLVLQSILLGGAMKLDALTYNLFVMPFCFCSIAVLLGIDYVSPGLFGKDLQTPARSDFLANWYLLLPNFAIAFMLNIAIALFIKRSSALSMVMASLIKDASVVIVSVVLMSDAISQQQVIFFSLQLFGIFTWSMTKTFPEKFENGLLNGFIALCTGANKL